MTLICRVGTGDDSVQHSQVEFLSSPSSSPPTTLQGIRTNRAGRGTNIRNSEPARETSQARVKIVQQEFRERRDKQVPRLKPEPSIMENIKSGTEDGPEGSEEQSVGQLRIKLFDSNVRLMVSESMVRAAE
ncbi:hypothetical protein IAQ61_003912 [Plenodomus lingam]|uniref:uncharacterized protein n=1 Tax=Leptosphaeria maculans TaxID=5022 RepID=UPI00331CDEB1|nr:hypothetical protein IAQ61_003912 [Plenodomus lingam]